MKFSRKNPSNRYLELVSYYTKMHKLGLPDLGIPADELYIGKSLLRHLPTIKKLVRKTHASCILDYGSGKGSFYNAEDINLPSGEKIRSIKDYLGVQKIHCYDPAYPPHSNLPKVTSGGVISTDALEHCPEEDIPWIVDEIFTLSDGFVFANVASYPASKFLPNGENAHATQRNPGWWKTLIEDVSKKHPKIKYHIEIEYNVNSIFTMFRTRKKKKILTNI